MKKNLIDQVKKRKTFAIISHPDAGKTTLTEKLLYFGGAIREAGSVKGRKTKKHATSDWMEIEKQRGISVTSSVLEFSYQDYRINILDTPGHQDFSEDTYRTLSAADSAVMLIDCAKGIESQTLKLFDVCRARGIPIFTFINKMDRHGKEPLDLLEEIEQVLNVRTYPMNWPIGLGNDFQGVYNRMNRTIELFQREKGRISVEGLKDPQLLDWLDERHVEVLKEEIALLDIAGNTFNMQQLSEGCLTPVFFGSAITNFGIQTFLEQFIHLAPAPSGKKTNQGIQMPEDEEFSGFIFKIQANMNPAHRDRIAFMRICSGTYSPGLPVQHVRTGRKLKLAQPQQFLAKEREMVQEAYAGDIIGLFDPGYFQVGDTLCERGLFEFEPLPAFSPELFTKVTNTNTMKYKQFQKGIQQLSEEGAIQVFRTVSSGAEDMILGAVGELQFEVFEYRMLHEYGVKVRLDRLPYRLARWPKGGSGDYRSILVSGSTLLLQDKEGDPVLLFESEFYVRHLSEKHPHIQFIKQKN